jgi:phosphatidylserine/phosphatidylglycerophosphate/cardiolipin synthase-like enzyme
MCTQQVLKTRRKQHSRFPSFKVPSCVVTAGMDPSKPCPREPWHDIHAKVEGPAAVDVAINFIERWVKQAGTRNMFKLVGGIGLHHRKVDVLLPEGLQQYLVRRLGWLDRRM